MDTKKLLVTLLALGGWLMAIALYGQEAGSQMNLESKGKGEGAKQEAYQYRIGDCLRGQDCTAILCHVSKMTPSGSTMFPGVPGSDRRTGSQRPLRSRTARIASTSLYLILSTPIVTASSYTDPRRRETLSFSSMAQTLCYHLWKLVRQAPG